MPHGAQTIQLPETVHHDALWWKMALETQHFVGELTWLPTHISSILRTGRPYKKVGPFCEIGDFAWGRQLQVSQEVIQSEIQNFIGDYLDDGKTYQPVNFIPALHDLERKDDPVYANFPGTIKALKALDTYVVIAKLCVLRKGQFLVEHRDFYPNTFNAHLVAKGPTANCFLAVGDELHEFKPSELFAFNASFLHSAWNDADEPRWILNMTFSEGNWLWAARLKRRMAYFFTETLVPWISRKGRYYIREDDND